MHITYVTPSIVEIGDFTQLTSDFVPPNAEEIIWHYGDDWTF